jgi:hypothetical protein
MCPAKKAEYLVALLDAVHLSITLSTMSFPFRRVSPADAYAFKRALRRVSLHTTPRSTSPSSVAGGYCPATIRHRTGRPRAVCTASSPCICSCKRSTTYAHCFHGWRAFPPFLGGCWGTRERSWHGFLTFSFILNLGDKEI